MPQLENNITHDITGTCTSNLLSTPRVNVETDVLKYENGSWGKSLR